MAHYTVKSVSGRVQLKQGANVVDAVPGMTVNPSDLILIGNESTIDILDSMDSKIYTGSAPGQNTVTRIIFDAKKNSRSNSATIHNKLRMGKDTNGTDGVVFVDKGKVTRALSTYAPDAERVQINVDQLSQRLYAMLTDPAGIPDLETSVEINMRRNPLGGMMFVVENTLTFPIYFNVFKVSAHNPSEIEISELGQPVGSYAIQPEQSIAREQRTAVSGGYRHLFVMTNYYFDIDELLTKLSTLLNERPPVTSCGEFPLFVKYL
ncbi:MAG: hypothetical protein K2M97_08445 [Muribaculaceae bacterium]|nr:hypothetical protein [Muribaculaceae bacterium]